MNIGLDSVYYAKITEDSNGYETYGTPKKLADAITANMSFNRQKVKISADDKLRYLFDLFADGSMGLNILEFTPEAQKDLFGATLDANGAIVSCSEDEPEPVAIGFRSMMRKGVYEYFWVYRVQFSAPNRTFNTKPAGEAPTVNTPTTEGTFMPRFKPRYDGDHPYETHMVDDGTNATAAILTAWFNSVYEPVNPSAQQSQGAG